VAHVIDDFPESFAEARAAFTVAATRNQPGLVLSVADLGLHGLLLQAVRPGALHDLVASTLGPLAGAAGQGRTQLLGTLASYFDHEGNNERTAADLHIHVNTLRYRLQRIEETLGVDLHDPESRFLIELALRTWQVLENPPPRAGSEG
jgi:purine catabolism regulator